MSATGGVKNVLPPSSGKPTVSPDAPSLYIMDFKETLFERRGRPGEPWFPGARYLVAGNPLEPSLPLTDGNICEELG